MKEAIDNSSVSNKVTLATLATVALTFVFALLQQLGVDVSTVLQGATSALVVALAGYFTPEQFSDTEDTTELD